MSIYASTPRTASVKHRRGKYLAAGVGWGHAHEANQILVAFRDLETDSNGKTWSGAVRQWHGFLYRRDGSICKADESQIIDARKVLSRWLRVYDVPNTTYKEDTK